MDPMVSAANSLQFYKMAVERANSFDNDLVRQAAYGIQLESPEGLIQLQTSNHVSLYPRLGIVNSQGLFDIILVNQLTAPIPWNHYVPA